MNGWDGGWRRERIDWLLGCTIRQIMSLLLDGMSGRAWFYQRKRYASWIMGISGDVLFGFRPL
jgi:hypothetical protein